MSGGATSAASLETVATEFGVPRGADDLQSFLDERPDLVSPTVVEHLGELVRQRVRVDVDEALRFGESAVAVAEKLHDQPSRGRSSRALANALWFKGNCKVAVGLFEKAAAHFEAAGMPEEVARTFSSSIQALSLLGEYPRAFAAAEKARNIFQTLGDTWRKARLELNVANIHHRQDRFTEALAAYEGAYAELVPWKDSEGLGVALHNMAVCLIMLNDFDRALGCYERARALCRENAMPLLEVQAEYNIAYLYFLRGDYETAIKGLARTRQSSRDAGDAYHQALCDLDEAEIYLELNLIDEAARLAEDATRQFGELGLKFETGRSLATCGLAKHKQGNSGRALELLEESKSVFEAESNRAWLALIDLYRAVILCERGELEAARTLCRNARDIFVSLHLERREIICDLVLARVAIANAELEEGRELCRTALHRLSGLDATELAFQAHVLLGDVERVSGNSTKAFESYNTARTEIETLRSSIQREDLKISFLQDKSCIYQHLIELCMNGTDMRPDAVLNYLEQAKSRTLVDLFPGGSGRLNLPHTQGAAADRIRSLKGELDWIYHRVELEQTSRDAVSIERINALRTEARQKEDSLVRAIRELDGLQPYADVTGRTLPMDSRDITSALHAEAAIVEFFRAGSNFAAVVVTRSRTAIVTLAPVLEVNAHIRMLEFQFSKFRLKNAYSDTYQAELLAATKSRLQELYQDLLQPLEALLEERHVVVVPHDVLHYVPFHALYNGSQYMIDRFTMSVAPSASVYTMCTGRPANTHGCALLMGVQDENAPFIEDEIRAVAAAVQEPSVFLGPDATTAVLRSEGPRSRLIHIATHGVFRRDNPIFSSLRMADGYMNLYDLYELKLPVELLTVSGCGTGLNVIAAGDELVGLTRGLLCAGAQSVLLSLWDVHDRTTSEFMSAFYRHLEREQEKASALRKAMLETRERQAHPYFWAPFVLVGKALN